MIENWAHEDYYGLAEQIWFAYIIAFHSLLKWNSEINTNVEWERERVNGTGLTSCMADNRQWGCNSFLSFFIIFLRNHATQILAQGAEYRIQLIVFLNRLELAFNSTSITFVWHSNLLSIQSKFVICSVDLFYVCLTLIWDNFYTIRLIDQVEVKTHTHTDTHKINSIEYRKSE